MRIPRAFDRFGNILLVKFDDKVKLGDKTKFANKLLKEHKSVTTILEKTGKFKGRLRKQQTKHLAGEKTKEVLYKENNCVFRFNIDKTYFSPRLSNERKEISKKVKKTDDVLVMFAGVAPYSIVIAKNSRASKVYSNEINREANKYGKLNAELNKVKNKIVFLDGDIKKIKLKKKFDIIVMPRPQLKETFLKQTFSLSKIGTKIYYYDFCKEDEIDMIVNKIKSEAKKYRKQIKILKIKKAGEIAPYKFRVRVDFKVL
ncbi:hypothetical protein ES703_95576 [subsurface metagenome]